MKIRIQPLIIAALACCSIAGRLQKPLVADGGRDPHKPLIIADGGRDPHKPAKRIV